MSFDKYFGLIDLTGHLGGPVDSEVTMGSKVDQVLAKSKELNGLEEEAVVLDARRIEIETRQAEISDQRITLRRQIATLVGEATGDEPVAAIDAKASGQGLANHDPVFRGDGFIGRAFAHMKAHPGVTFSPESISAAIGEPDRNSLASTTLRRLCDKQKVIERLRKGAYVYPPSGRVPPRSEKGRKNRKGSSR